MSRIRSPAHPDVSLERAVELVRPLHERVRSNPVDREVAVKEMGYSGMTGASGKMLANLIHYGLIAKAGKGMVRVTGIAIDILHPKTTEDRRRALHQAGMTPGFFQRIRAEFTDGLPSETWLRSFMMREGFSGAAIEPAMSSYLDTSRFLQQENAYESHGAPLPLPVDSSSIDDVDEDDNMETAADRDARTPPPRREGAAKKDSAKDLAERTVFTEEGAPGQYLTLKVAGEVTDDMLEALEDYVKRQRKRLDRSE